MEREEINGIGNYYGGLNIMYFNKKYYWCIENYYTDFNDLNDWKEIPKSLYDELKLFNSKS